MLLDSMEQIAPVLAIAMDKLAMTAWTAMELAHATLTSMDQTALGSATVMANHVTMELLETEIALATPDPTGQIAQARAHVPAKGATTAPMEMEPAFVMLVASAATVVVPATVDQGRAVKAFQGMDLAPVPMAFMGLLVKTRVLEALVSTNAMEMGIAMMELGALVSALAMLASGALLVRTHALLGVHLPDAIKRMALVLVRTASMDPLALTPVLVALELVSAPETACVLMEPLGLEHALALAVTGMLIAVKRVRTLDV